MKIGLEYIKYRRKAKKRHGIHSPFVYELSDSALGIQPDPNDLALIGKITGKFLNDKRSITVTDFGAGSHHMGHLRKIKDIFRNSSSRGGYGWLLYKLARYYRPGNILEMGTSLGMGTSYLYLGAPDARITTVEACPATHAIALETISALSTDTIQAVNQTFDDYFAGKNLPLFDLVFVDGHHDGKALLRYMEGLKDCTHDNTFFILDDIRWSDSMLDAWNTLKNLPEYHVSMDFFRFGILLRRPEQRKEHFTLRL